MTCLRGFHGRVAIASLSALLIASGFAQGARAEQPSYVVQPSDTLTSIAQRFNTSVSALAQANHLGNADFIRPGMRLVLTGSAVAPAATTTKGGNVYVVRWGDTLTSISQRFGVDTPSISQLNALAQPSLIRAGQQLLIPATIDTPPASTPPAAPVAGETTYTVQAGDSLVGLEARFGLRAGSIATLNHLDPAAYLRIGRHLMLPIAAPAAVAGNPVPASVTTSTYTVQAGDTLSTIGWRYGTSADALAAQNGLSASSVLQIGQRLTVPGSSEPFSTQSEIAATLTSEALRAGVDPALVKAVAWQESGWQMVTASDGGMGVMQLMPDSVTWASTSLLGYSVNPYNPVDNIRAGVAMLHYYLGVYPDVRHVLAAYHQGMASVDNVGIMPETQHYIDNILALQQQYGG